MSSERDRTRLRHMLDASLKIEEFTGGMTAASFRRDESCNWP
jgi:uncharacterized protein with HEPN domain